MIHNKKGFQVPEVVIYLILALIVLLGVILFQNGSLSQIVKQPQHLVSEVSDSWNNFVGKETQEEKQLRLHDEQLLLDFTKEVTSFLDDCLVAAESPCLCTFSLPPTFSSSYHLRLMTQDNTYYSVPLVFSEDRERLLEDPKPHVKNPALTLCTYTGEILPATQLTFSAEEDSFSFTDGKETYTLGNKLIHVYKPTPTSLCFLPEGTSLPTQKPVPSCLSSSTP